MPADDLDQRGPPIVGFHSYADDTPRADDDWQDAPTRDEPALDGPAPNLDRDAPPGRRFNWWIGGGVLAAVCGALLAAGLADPRPDERASPAMNVEVSPRAPPAAVASSPAAAKLEVLPPDQPKPVQHAAVDRAVADQARVVDLSPTAIPPRVVAPPTSPPARDAVATAPETPAPQRTQPQRPARSSYACSDLPTRAMAMVCGDPRLARLDLRMKRAYEAALEAGASPRRLRADQEDWLDVREEAAAVSRRSVENIYRQRIAELEDLAFR